MGWQERMRLMERKNMVDRDRWERKEADLTKIREMVKEWYLSETETVAQLGERIRQRFSS